VGGKKEGNVGVNVGRARSSGPGGGGKGLSAVWGLAKTMAENRQNISVAASMARARMSQMERFMSGNTFPRMASMICLPAVYNVSITKNFAMSSRPPSGGDRGIWVQLLHIKNEFDNE